MYPELCPECDNVLIRDTLDTNSQECPYCQLDHRLTIFTEDDRYLVFLSMLERAKSKPGIATNFFEFEPTRRELELFNHGDQILCSEGLWRIAGKTYGPEGREPRMWIALQNKANIGVKSDRIFLSTLPPFIPSHVADRVEADFARMFRFVPISANETELVLAGPPIDFETEDSLTFHFSKAGKIEYWQTTEAAFEKAWHAYYNKSKIAPCGVGFGYECPQRWKDLQLTDQADVRFCDSCNEKVYLVYDHSEITELHIQQKHCIARFSQWEGSPPMMTIGVPNLPPEED